MQIYVQIKGLKDLERKFNGAKRIVRQELRTAMRRSVIYLEGQVKSLTPVDTGRLRASITHEVRGMGSNLKGVVGSNVVYAPYVEFGTRPHWPPISAVARWAELHGIHPFLVARAIARHGTPARRMFQKGLEGSTRQIQAFFQGAAQRIVKRLS